MNRTLWKLALGMSLCLLALPSDVRAGRGGGGGRGGPGRGGFGGGGPGGMGRSPMGNSPSFSTPRGPSNLGRPQSGDMGNRPQPGQDTMGRGQAGGSNNADRPNRSNAGSAAAGADVANRNQPPDRNAGAAAAGAGYANRNQPPDRNAGAAAAGAGYANRNQGPAYPNAGAAAAGAGYANRNQGPAYPNAGAAAVGAGYANRNQYNQYHPGMVNGYWNNNNSAAAWGAAGLGAAGLGAGYASGVGAWGAGSPLYAWGYSGYGNPYTSATPVMAVAAQPGVPQQPAAPVYNYSQPISTTAPAPEPSVADQATAAFDQARGAFKAGDYAQAQQLVQQALAQMPNDTTLHEFLALVLFAQRNYEQAAAPLYAVLSVGPGWDWTTLSGMYPDVDTYTQQLRNLEAYLKANPRSAQARFVLAYQYLCEGHVEDAVAQLKKVVELQPGDTLSAQLIAHFQPSGSTPPAPAEAAPAAAPAATGKLVGNWTAAPAKDAKITLAIRDDGRFTWAATSPGKPPMSIAGQSNLADGTLTLTDQGGQNGALTGQVAWQDDNHFSFRVLGAPSDDPGLKFAR